MKKIINTTVILLILSSFYSFHKKEVIEPNCRIFHEGTFKYADEDLESHVVIEGSLHTEYFDNRKYYVRSKIEWLSECECNLTVQEATVPDFPFGKGTVMNLKIDETKGKSIYYTSTIKGLEFKGELLKIK